MPCAPSTSCSYTALLGSDAPENHCSDHGGQQSPIVGAAEQEVEGPRRLTFSWIHRAALVQDKGGLTHNHLNLPAPASRAQGASPIAQVDRPITTNPGVGGPTLHPAGGHPGRRRPTRRSPHPYIPSPPWGWWWGARGVRDEEAARLLVRHLHQNQKNDPRRGAINDVWVRGDDPNGKRWKGPIQSHPCAHFEERRRATCARRRRCTSRRNRADRGRERGQAERQKP